MGAVIRVPLRRSDALAFAGLSNAESAPRLPMLVASAAMTGTTWGLRRLLVQKTNAGAITITVRGYSALTGGVQIFEQPIVLTGNADWNSVSFDPPLVLAAADALHLTGEASAAGAHNIDAYIEGEVGSP